MVERGLGLLSSPSPLRVLFIAGHEDLLVSEESIYADYRRLRALYPRGFQSYVDMVVVKDAGHYSFVDRRNKIAETIYAPGA